MAGEQFTRTLGAGQSLTILADWGFKKVSIESVGGVTNILGTLKAGSMESDNVAIGDGKTSTFENQNAPINQLTITAIVGAIVIASRD